MQFVLMVRIGPPNWTKSRTFTMSTNSCSSSHDSPHFIYFPLGHDFEKALLPPTLQLTHPSTVARLTATHQECGHRMPQRRPQDKLHRKKCAAAMKIHHLLAYLQVNDAARAIEFYTSVFGATEKFRLTDPTVALGTPCSISAVRRSCWLKSSLNTASWDR